MWWGYNSHLGCSVANFPSAHEFYSNYDTLTIPLKMDLAKRSGFERRTKIQLAKLGEVIRELRRQSLKEAEARRNAPADRGDVNPSLPPTLRVSGTFKKDVPGVGNFLKNSNYVGQEDPPRCALRGDQLEFGRLEPQQNEFHGEKFIADILPDGEGPKLVETRSLLGENVHRRAPQKRAWQLPLSVFLCFGYGVTGSQAWFD